MRLMRALSMILVLSGTPLVAGQTLAETGATKNPGLKVGSVIKGEGGLTATLTKARPNSFTYRVAGTADHPPFTVVLNGTGVHADFTIEEGMKTIKDTLKTVFGIGEGGGGTSNTGACNQTTITVNGNGNTITCTVNAGSGSGSGSAS
jgi:hypothetical protein